MKRKIIILGSTGSIGRQALDIVRRTGEFEVVGLGARQDAATLSAQMREFRPRVAARADRTAVPVLKSAGVPDTMVLAGPDAMRDLAAWGEADLVLVAVVGIAGLLPVLAALRAGRDVALANKETLVAGGSVVLEEVRRQRARHGAGDARSD